MAINIEGAIRGDDPRIPKVESLNGVTILGFLNGKVVSIDATLIDLIDITTNYLPYIGEDYYAYVWNKESQEYVKTGIYVKGEQGEKGDKGDTGDKGDKGDKGDAFTYDDFTPTQIEDLKRPAIEAAENANNAKGWSPSIVFEEYNGKQIKKLIGYIGGTGAEPTANVGQYFTENGFTNNKDLAVNFKGTDGIDGSSVVNINPSSTMQQARMWIGTRNEYDIQKPLPNDVITFIL